MASTTSCRLRELENSTFEIRNLNFKSTLFCSMFYSSYTSFYMVFLVSFDILILGMIKYNKT